MAKKYIILIELSSKKEAEQIIEEISNLSESFWNEYDSLSNYEIHRS